MNALDNLINRYSTPAVELCDPAPDDAQIETLFKAAASAPDHCALKPWRFIVIRGEARQRLGDVFADAYLQREPNVPEAKLENYRNKPLRAPLIITVVASITPDNPKVPEQEQIISTACAAQHIQLAAQAMGFGSIWLTGINTRDWHVGEALGIGFDEKIIGYLYIGTPSKPRQPQKRQAMMDMASEWHGPVSPEETVI